jgi:predicted metalloprotease with PDZ domain
MARAGLIELPALLGDLTGVVSYVVLSPATRFRTAEDMSRLAPFVDAASWIDRTNWPNTFISYYVHGAALGLGLDFAIREKTAGRQSLDDVMRLLWTRHGKPGGKKVGYVDKPYGPADVTAAIAEVAGDQAWAADLMSRHVQGHEVMDYRRLVGLAGLTLKPRFPGRATLGVETEAASGGLRISGPTRIGSAGYKAGLDVGDAIRTVNGHAVGTTEQLDAALRAHKPGATVRVTFVQRGREVTADAVLDEDSRFDIVALESIGSPLTAAQKAFRASWVAGR